MSNIYEELGFDSRLSLIALDVFGVERSNEGVEWLLQETEKGTMPKRFKTGKSSDFVYTFYRSRIEYSGCQFIVTDYDAKYHLIQIEPYRCNHMPRWIHLSDPAITWLQEAHVTKPVLQPVVEGQVHFLGRVHLPYQDAFDSRDSRKHQECVEALTSLDKLRELFTYSTLYVAKNTALAHYWYSLLQYTDKYNMQTRITPEFPAPKSISPQRITYTCALFWSKLHLIVDLNNLQSVNDSPETIDLYNKYCNPREYLEKQRNDYQEACVSPFKLQNTTINDGVFSADVFMSHLIFKDSLKPESTYWTHLLHILNLVKWGEQFALQTSACLRTESEQVSNDMRLMTLRAWSETIQKWCLKLPKHVDTFPDCEKHQRQAIQWMVHRENCAIMGQNNWEEVILKSGFRFYKHTLGNIALSPGKRFKGGGILSLCSGSGKKRCVIETIKHMNNDLNWQNCDPKRQTLIVVEANKIGHWKNEFERWAPGIEICMYHDRKRVLNSAPVVLTTYYVCNKEFSFCDRGPLSNILWRRVVMDDGHRLSQMNSIRFHRMIIVKTSSHGTKWILTSKPFRSNVINLCGFLRLLNEYPFNPRGIRHRTEKASMYCLTSYSEVYPTLCSRLKRMMKGIIFYQNKDTVNIKLASLKHYTAIVKANETHQRLIDILNNKMNERPKTRRIMKYFRRACSNPLFCPLGIFGKPLPIKKAGGISVRTSNMQQLKLDVNDTFKEKILESFKDETSSCPICMEHIETPIVTNCGHSYCFDCIQEHMKTSKNCPMCRGNVQNLFEVKEEKKQAKDKVVSIHPVLGHSEVDKKVTTLLNLYKTNQKCEWISKYLNTNKTVIFTDFNENIGDISRELKCPNAYILSNMKLAERQNMIDKFQKDVNVIIMSTRMAESGIVLTNAQRIIFFEPTEKKSTCINKVNRLGQKHEKIEVVTLVTAGSIEQTMELQ